MRLGYNTNGLQNHRLDDALRLLADHGFECVALTLDVGHLDPFRATTTEIDATASLVRRLGLDVSIETGARFLLDPRQKHEPTLMTRGTEARARRLEFYARASEIGRALGASVLSFWSGVDRKPGPDSDAWLLDGVRATCELVRGHGLVPALEPEPGMAVATVEQFEELARTCGTVAPALTLDVGHLYVEDGEPPELACRRLASRCVQVHLEDVRRGVHEHLAPGEGDVDFPAVLSALAGGGYSGAVCFELSRSSHCAPEAIARCTRVWEAARRDWTA